MTMKINNASARAANDAINAKIDAAATAPSLEIRTGAQPATPETAATGTVLVTFPLPNGTFPTDGVFPAAVQVGTNAVATARTIAAADAVADGVAGYFRVYDGDGNPVQDGTITDTAGSGDMKLANINIVTGISVTIVSWTATVSQ